MTTSAASSATDRTAGFPADLTPAQLLFPDLQRELASTRKILERVPDDRLDFKPHDKSMSLGTLANHLVELLGFAQSILRESELDFGARQYEPMSIATSAERLAKFDALSREMTQSLESADWNALAGTWALRQGDQVLLSDQKGRLLRSFALSHMGHHRAQLGVYLRLLGVNVPGTYGPSADEM